MDKKSVSSVLSIQGLTVQWNPNISNPLVRCGKPLHFKHNSAASNV